MNILTTTVARVLFALPFGIFGLIHFLSAHDMVGMVPSWVPGGIFWVYLTGIALIAASVSIITKNMGYLASLMLALLLLIFILTIHLPGLSNEATMNMALPAMLKDMALMGAALTYAGLLEGED